MRDLRHAEHSLDDADYEWAAFASQQAAEKTVKALLWSGGEPWGKTASRLDKHYIPTRYPNGFAEGYPGKLYTRGEAEGAIADAKTIIDFCGWATGSLANFSAGSPRRR